MSRFVCFTLLCCVLVAFCEEPSEAACKMEAGVDFYGNDLEGQSQRLDSAVECCRLCNTRLLCEAWSFWSDLGICWPKLNDTGRGLGSDLQQHTIISGYRSTPATDILRCGNGVVDEEEECDKALGSCCGPDCKFHHSHHICRASDSECDPPDHCDGKTAKCAVTHLPDGTPCGPEKAHKCLRGVCAFQRIIANGGDGAGVVHAHWHTHAKP